ncbi:hypothetical protein AB0P17_08335 [Streptomyces sp. NPDC088124]|uniref:hypothetical protein n=1 Tax=Streptomyces sp. NPDC088124 TaxID=3154654 RepID=UPI0034398DD5
MRVVVIVSKAVLVVVGTWLLLCAVIAFPPLLPARWEYYLISPASVGLWLIAMLVTPFAVCWRLRRWIVSRSPRSAERSSVASSRPEGSVVCPSARGVGGASRHGETSPRDAQRTRSPETPSETGRII